MLDIPKPFAKTAKAFNIDYVFHLGAGPTNCTPETMRLIGNQPLVPMCKENFKLMDDIKEMTKYVYQTRNAVTFVSQTSGSGGNDTMMANLADPGETVVVAVAGMWGARVALMAERYNYNVIKLESKPGEVYSFEELEQALIQHRPVALFVTQGESTGGTLQPLDGLGDICHKYDCLLAVDAVVSVGVVPLLVDQWGIDAVNGGTQKGIGAPAGMCLMSFSPRAYRKIVSKKQKPPCILDVESMARAWNCLEQGPRTYHCTYNSCMLAAVRQALEQLCHEGLESAWKRHRDSADLLVERAQAELDLEHFVHNPDNRFCGVTCLKVPQDLSVVEMQKYAQDKFGVELGIGFGPSVGALRLGLLGPNAQLATVDFAIEVLRDTMDSLRKEKIPKSA